MTPATLIVGGGLGGLSAAIHLARAGQRVTILEKNERVGGKANLVSAGGYRFDTGPSLMTMPWILRELYATAGANLDDDLTLLPLESTCRYHWPDGRTFEAYQLLPLLLGEIERFDRRDVDGFLRFLAYSRRIYEAVAGPFLLNPFDGLRDLITPALVRDSWKIDSFRTVDAAVRSFFHSPHLRQMFNRYATYNGSSPYRAPATFNIIPYVEFAEGGWYVRGGMYQLVRALAGLARRMGVTIHTGAEVTAIRTEHGRATGVQVGRDTFSADTVVVNADPRYTYTHLLPDRRQSDALARLEPSCSGFVLWLGIDRVYPQLGHHTIFFSQDYPQEFRAIFDARVPATDPTVYVCATSVTDAEHAPAGHMNLFVLVNAPATGRVNWEREGAAYRDLTLAKLERMGLDNLRQHIRFEQMMTPDQMETRYNATGGAIYGLASNTMFSAFLRPPLRARATPGLYFVGGGTHPGGGIPLVLLSGRAVAQRVLADGATRPIPHQENR